MGECVTVLVNRLDPQLPAASELMERAGLSPREAEVACLIARGLTNAQAAAKLGRSDHTIRHHLESIFLKLGVTSRSELILTIIRGDGRAD